MKESLYIIGGSGFVGKHLCRILSADYNITVFDRFIDDAFFSGFPEIKTVRHDILGQRIPEEYPTPSYIINLAATMVTADRDFSGIDSLIADNLRIIGNLHSRFGKAEQLKLFVQFGSIEEYGPIEPPLSEEKRERPNSAYSLMKQACTNYTLALASNENFPACVLRPGNLFGKGQNPNRFIPYVLEQLVADAEVNVTPCEQKRDFIHIDDFGMLIGKILGKPSAFRGQVVNVSSGKSIALKDIIETFREQTGSQSKVNYGALPYRKGEVMDLCCPIDKLERLLGEKIEINTVEKLKEYAKDR